jgi:preprotein translocase subunit SecE
MDPQQIETQPATRFDSLLLSLAVLLLVGGMVSFYYFAGDLNALVRTLILLASIGVGLALAYQTSLGKDLWGYVLGSRTELRKVVWPSKQESLQATLMIAVVVLIMSLILWALDSALLALVKLVTGR